MKVLSCYILKALIVLLPVFSLFACGIDEIYYLPQVPGPESRDNFRANLIIPAYHLSGLNYASGYRIYYRIYLSSEQNVVFPESSNLIPTFVNDYNALWRFENPLDTTLITNFSTFSNRRYHELYYQIDRTGGTLFFWFPNVPGELPTVKLNDEEPQELIRSEQLKNQIPNYDETEKYFINTDQLNNNVNAITTFNADVAPGQSDTFLHAYVAMYIVALGVDPITFHYVFSKPTFIGLFKLPNSY